jgi:hypothetical protein
MNRSLPPSSTRTLGRSAPVLRPAWRAWPALLATALALSLATAAPPASAEAGRGYTWGKYWHDETRGIDLVGNAGSGDPLHGDTACATALPLLCLKVDSSPRPNYPIDTQDGGLPKEGYRGWAGGSLATTAPIVGETLATRADADSICAASFGEGWRLAEFHDGLYILGMDERHYYGNTTFTNRPWQPKRAREGGWAFYAYGNVRDDTRWWVAVRDQPGNCWDR